MGKRAGVGGDDARLFIAELGAMYAWASPDYIADHLTEPQLHGYSKSIAEIRQRSAKASAIAFCEGLLKWVLPAIFGKGKR